MLYLLTSHENGSLNLWHLSVDEESNFTVILNISHASRMCGHRFQISKVSECYYDLMLLSEDGIRGLRQECLRERDGGSAHRSVKVGSFDTLHQRHGSMGKNRT